MDHPPEWRDEPFFRVRPDRRDRRNDGSQPADAVRRQAFRQVTLPFISTVDKAEEAVRRIDAGRTRGGVAAGRFQHAGARGHRDEIVKRANGPVSGFLRCVSRSARAGARRSLAHAHGRAHGMADIGAYTCASMRRISRWPTTTAPTRDYERADVILVGVRARERRRPASTWRCSTASLAANYPLTEDDLEGKQLPAVVEPAKQLFGLTIEPARLQQIRKERRPGSRYASASSARTRCAPPSSCSSATALPRDHGHLHRGDREPRAGAFAIPRRVRP